MAEITLELIYEVLRDIQSRVAGLQDGQRSIRDELTTLRGHQLLLQKDIYNIHERLDGIEKKVDRIERRLQLSDVPT